MDILPNHFRVCNIFGLWYTDHHYFFAKMTWRFIVFSILGLFNLSQIIELAVNRGNINEMIEVLFHAITYIGLLLKLFNFVLRQDEMWDILEDFRSKACQPMTQEEIKIIEKRSTDIKNIYLFVMILSLSCGFTMLISAMLSFFRNEFNLPFKVYNPYDITNPKNYMISYCIQIFATIVGVILNVSMDTMAYAFIILVTCQHEINSSRYLNFTTPIKICVEHQILLKKLNVKIQDFFIRVVAPLFFFSLITLGASILQMSQISVANLQFVSLLLYLGCMLSQVFFYCWYGNELLLKSQNVMDKIYESDWYDYDSQERRNLWFAMLSGQEGFYISYHGVCRLSLNTFIWVIKTSYAAFNLLKILKVDMDLLPLNFQTLTYCGLWLENTNRFATLKKYWGYIVRTIIFYFTITEVIELYMLKDVLEEVIGVMFLTVTFICLCLKILNFSIKKPKLKKLLQCFREDFCKTACAEENTLMQKYVIQHTQIFKNILVLSQSTGVIFCLIPFITLKPTDFVPPFKTYQFYDDSTTIGFSVTCVIHFLAAVFGVFINVSMDTMIYGFIILATFQFELVSYRIIKSINSKDKDTFRQNIIHHIHINKIVYKVKEVFISVVVPLFILSLLTLCASIFQMVQSDITGVEFLGLAMYLLCMLAQVFLYCWYGNELKLKSEVIVKNISQSDWIDLDQKQKKVLYFILMFANKNCYLSWKGQCSLALDTFVWIMKTSYSAFSLLQSASDENK
ncbi:uncharacterized protein LOC131668164 [Phymastichus coffea]|uniref:uncharacterized protein LOC131668164 n=1 Tax=Phymastichus coffea TaxID=108790 RepID=UPI00273CA1F8|nr:uncharacterized protein LOC131668164 [Phymastichus coffea]